MRIKDIYGKPLKTAQCTYTVLWVDHDGQKHAYCKEHHHPVAICQVCGEIFHTKRPTGAKTCSDKCRKKRSRSKV